MFGRTTPRTIDRSSPQWILTYADVATLLLTFFIFLFSASAVSEARFQAAAGSLRSNMGLRPRAGSVVEPQVPSQVARRQDEIDVRRGAPGERAEVLAVAQGARVVLGGAVLFGRGSADVDAGARRSLLSIADEIRGLPNIVEVHGHCEPGESADELVLSLHRAAAVVRFLTVDGGIRANRLRAMGAGSFEPAAAGIHADEGARDRRVEVIVVREAAAPVGHGAR